MPSAKSASELRLAHAEAEDPTYTRLHITPCDAEFLNAILPESTFRPLARNVSFHTIQAFPENRYGFVELPHAEAEKLRTKFHGATLKGCKMRVEKAKRKREIVPDVMEPEDTPDDAAVKKQKKEKRRKDRDAGEDDEKATKKRKKDRNVVEGVMLEEGRKVKRGWTIPEEEAKKEKIAAKKSKDKKEKKKKRQRSVYTDKEECLMNITVPPNAPVLQDEKKKKSKRGKSKGQITAHEFEHTTKFPTFLKEPSRSGPAQSASNGPAEDQTGAPSEDESSSASTSSTSADSDDEMPAPSSTKATKDARTRARTPETKDDAESAASSPVQPGSARPKSSGSMRSLTIKIPPPLTPSSKVHPLEALYKKKKTGDNETSVAAEAFSFFGGDEPGSDGPAKSHMPPMTPFSKQEFEWRSTRSAAPTPDTAHPARRVFWAPDGDNNVEEEDEEDEENGDEQGDELLPTTEDKETTQEQPAESDFRKTFYEKRRELGRSWVERKKTAQKEKKARDRKLRAPRT
jgi:hypothetical protein